MLRHLLTIQSPAETNYDLSRPDNSGLFQTAISPDRSTGDASASAKL